MTEAEEAMLAGDTGRRGSITPSAVADSGVAEEHRRRAEKRAEKRRMMSRSGRAVSATGRTSRQRRTSAAQAHIPNDDCCLQ